MEWSRHCAAVIPCLNEALRVAQVVQAVRRQLPTILVVDDGSSDATSQAAAEAGAQVVRHPARTGKGAALQTGWRWARERGFKWALALDGDGQHSPDDIPRFFECAEASGAALVVGNRMSDPRSMPWLRRQVNRWMSARLSETAGRPLADTQSGFRLMNLEVWSGLKIDASHFEVESEVLLAFALAAQRIEFVPIQVIYRDERSKIRPLQDTWRWFRWWRRVRGRAARR